MDTGFAACIVALSVAVGVLFRSMQSWIQRQDTRNEAQGVENVALHTKDQQQQQEIALLRLAVAETQDKFRKMSLTCPVTQTKCPLQDLFK